MSDAIKIARQAPKLVEGLLADMFAANAEDNRIALGGIYSGQQYIQLQLVATCNPAALLDDDSGEDDDEEGPAMAPTHGPLVTHWLAARAEFIAAGGEARGIETSPGSCWRWGPSASTARSARMSGWGWRSGCSAATCCCAGARSASRGCEHCPRPAPEFERSIRL